MLTLIVPPPTVTEPVPVLTVPFTLRGGNILVRAIVDGSPAMMILDTGSSTSTLSAQWAAAHPVRLTGAPVAAKGTGDMQVSLGTVREIQIGPVTLRDETVAILPLDGVGAAHGIPIDGTIGFSFFARYVVEIDYAGRALRLHDPGAYALPNGATVLPVDLSMRIPIAQVRLSALGRSPVIARLVVDVGTGGIGVILTSPFRRAHDADFPLDAGIERPIGHGVGGAPRGRIVRLASVNVGNLTFAGPTAAYAERGEGFLAVDWADGAIGTPILSRGSLVVDYPHNRVLLLASSERGAVFEHDASGLTLVAEAPSLGRVRVTDVVRGSPAADAGVRVGDVLTAVDGEAVSGRTLDVTQSALEQVGADRVLDIVRNGERRQVRIRLRDLLR